MPDTSQETVYVRSYGKGANKPRQDIVKHYLGELLPDVCRSSLDERTSWYVNVASCIDEISSHYAHDKLSQTITEVTQWVSSHAAEGNTDVGTSVLSNGTPALFQRLQAQQSNSLCVSLHSKECPNVKTALKIIVNRLIHNDLEKIEKTLQVDRRLTYDFDILVRWLEANNDEDRRKQVILIHLEDADSFDPDIVDGLVSYMHTYASALRLHLLLSIRTSAPVFEQRIRRENQGKLAAKVFLTDTDSHLLLNSSVERLADAYGCYVGDGLFNILANEHAGNIPRMLKYACLVHFATNPLALLTPQNARQYWHIIEGLPSFSACSCEELKSGTEDLDQATFERLVGEQMAKVSGVREKGMFMCELLIDGSNLHQSTFAPTYRATTEAVLADPGIYTPAASRYSIPAVCLYQLCREASIYVNIYDLYISFRALMHRPLESDASSWNKVSLAWFLQGVAELKLMGVVRDCKRKFECVEKVSWKGV